MPPPGEVLTSTIKRKKKRLKGFRSCLCQDPLCLALRKRPEMLPNKMVLLPTGEKGVFSTRAMVQAFRNIPERCGNHATEECDCTGDNRLQVMMQGVKHCCLIDDACDCLTVPPPRPRTSWLLTRRPAPCCQRRKLRWNAFKGKEHKFWGEHLRPEDRNFDGQRKRVYEKRRKVRGYEVSRRR